MTEISFDTVNQHRQRLINALTDLGDAVARWQADVDRGDLRDATRQAFGVAEYLASTYDEAVAAYSHQVAGETGLCPETDGVLTCVLEPYHPGQRHQSPTGAQWWAGPL